MAFTKITSDGIGDNAVTSDKIASGAITAADIPNGEITAAKLATTAISDKLGYTPVSPTTLNSSLAFKANTSSLGTLAYVSPTGTGDTTKFLRGDNSWQAPGLSSLSDLSLSSVAGNDIISYAGTTTSTGGTFTTSNWTLAEWGKSNATVTVNDATSTLVTQLQLLTTGNTITVTKTSGGSSTLTLTGAPTLSYGTTYVIPVNTNSGTGSTESLTTIVIPSGSVTTYSWKNTQINASNISTGTLPNARLGSGVILQYAQAVKTDSFSGTSPNVSTYTAITGLSATITPRSTSSKILIMTTINYDSTRGNSGGGFAIFRNGSILDGAIGASNGIQYRVFADFGANANADQSGMSRSFQVIDSPSSSSALTYDIRFCQDTNAFTTYINRARSDAQNTDDGRFASSIILMEIA